MGLLDGAGQFFNNPLTILGLSTLNSADRPAAGLLSGLSAYNTLQAQNLNNQAVMSALMARKKQAEQQQMQMLAAQRYAAQNPNIGGAGYLQQTGDIQGATGLAGLTPEQESLISKINPSDFTPASVEAFSKSGDFGDLVPQDKGPSQVINVNGQVDPFIKSMQDKLGAQFVTNQENAQLAADSLESINQSLGLIKKGMVVGGGAKALVAIGGYLKQAGFEVESDPIANAQAYGAIAAKRTAQIIKAFGSGTGLSDADRKYAEGAAAGDIEMQPEALLRLLEINAKASRNVINRFNAQARAVEATKAVPYPLTINMPAYPDFPTADTGFDDETQTLIDKYTQ